MVRYIYNQRQCGNCKGCVRTWDMSSRTVYACETCQPLDLGSGVGEGAAPLKLAASRALAMQVCAHLPGRRCHGTSSHIKSSHFITHQISTLITLHHASPPYLPILIVMSGAWQGLEPSHSAVCRGPAVWPNSTHFFSPVMSLAVWRGWGV